MSRRKFAYILFYFSCVLIVLVASFFQRDFLVYVKPLIPISLILIQISDTKSINLFYLISMIVLIINDTMVYLDFVRYFDLVAVTIVVFYVLNVYLLRKYITFAELQIKKLASFPIIISMMLISYLIYSISDLVLPDLQESIVSFFTILLALLFFVGVCFFIYINDVYEGNFRLFVSACCCLFVNALLLINHFYYQTTLFTVLDNGVEIMGLYFFIQFLINARPEQQKNKKEKFL